MALPGWKPSFHASIICHETERSPSPRTVAVSSCSFHHWLVLCDFNSVTPPPLDPRRRCFILSVRSSHNRLPSLGASKTILRIVKLSLSYLKVTFPQGIHCLQGCGVGSIVLGAQNSF